MKVFIRLTFFLAYFTVVTSCVSKKDIYYMQEMPEDFQTAPFENMKIQKGDILDIQVSALRPETVAMFNRSGQTQTANVESLKVTGYLVDEQGEIKVPYLGNVAVEGLNTRELEIKLVEEISPHVSDPVVSVRLVNYKVTVIGEVRNPGTISVIEERLTIPQALGYAGDLTINGSRTDVMLVRQTEDGYKTHMLDLTQTDLYSSPFFYLNQNDVIYVRPNGAKVKSAGYIGNVGAVLGVVSLLLTVTLLITNN
jgi:polysaccharide export outer membrane protein